MSSLRAEMRSYLRGRGEMDEHSLAKTFLSQRTKAALEPLLAEEFANLRRDEVRAIETLVLSQMREPRPAMTLDRVRSGLNELGPLLDEEYRIGDGIVRRAGDMTIQEWKLRRTMLAAQRSGIDRAIEVCDRAISAIETAGVKTLRDVAAAELQPPRPSAPRRKRPETIEAVAA